MKRLLGFTTCLIFASLATAALACSVPVFRYALERWKSDPYELVVFHRGSLSAEQESLLARFVVPDAEGVSIANLEVRQVDLDGEINEATRGVWESLAASDDAPQLALLQPTVSRSPEVPLRPIWSGPLDEHAPPLVLDSPLRRTVAEQLLAGETAVWVLLESGRAEEDDAAFRTLEAELAHANSTLKLPEVDEQDLDDGLLLVDPTKLRVSFALRRLSRDDAAEAALVGMLLASEPDLADYDAPMAFPLFGRGRVLYALVGEGINAETIMQACSELLGPCTCQVKEQNPGSDLLMPVDWERLVALSDEEERPLPALPGLPAPEVADAPVEASDESATDHGDTLVAVASMPATPTDDVQCDLPVATTQAGSSVVRNTLVTAGIAVLGVAIAGAFFIRRRG